LGAAVWLLLDPAARILLDSGPAPHPRINAPFVTTSNIVVERMVELAGLTADDLVYDLGCGDGRIVITAALSKGCRGVGFDIDPRRVAEARENARQHAVDQRVEFVEQDIFTVDLSKADVAMMYLLPWMMDRLLPQFQQMKEGCRIVSHEFWLEGVEPDDVVELDNPERERTSSIYVYRTPLRFNPAMIRGKPPRPSGAE
jgi:predicted RNA methylase